MPRARQPQGPENWFGSMPPPATLGPSEFGVQPTDRWGYPINTNFSPGGNLTYPSGGLNYPSPTDVSSPYQNPTLEITGATPSPGGPNIGGGTIGINSPTGNFNYYDAGNGVVYVYDANWNYVGTTTNTTVGPAGGTAGPTQSQFNVPSVTVAGNTGPSGGGWDPLGNSINWGAQGGIGPQQALASGDAPGAAITTLFSKGQHLL